MVWIAQMISLKRCTACKRWQGVRRIGEQPGTVEYDAEADKGLCHEGPWHGSLRSARSACGRWVQWAALGELPAAGECGE